MLKLDEDEKRFIDAIGDPSRLKILLVLWKSDQELTVYKVCQCTGLGRSSVSRHLRNLVEARLVSTRIYGEIPLYSISREDFRARAIIDFLLKSNFNIYFIYIRHLVYSGRDYNTFSRSLTR